MAHQDAQKLGAATLAIARAAGLEIALANYPDCVAEAALAAAQDLADMPAIEGTVEPWPPMRARTDPCKI